MFLTQFLLVVLVPFDVGIKRRKFVWKCAGTGSPRSEFLRPRARALRLSPFSGLRQSPCQYTFKVHHLIPTPEPKLSTAGKIYLAATPAPLSMLSALMGKANRLSNLVVGLLGTLHRHLIASVCSPINKESPPDCAKRVFFVPSAIRSNKNITPKTPLSPHSNLHCAFSQYLVGCR